MEVDSVGIIAILSMSYITTRVVKTQKCVVKITRVPVENEITTLSVVKIAIKFSPCILVGRARPLSTFAKLCDLQQRFTLNDSRVVSHFFFCFCFVSPCRFAYSEKIAFIVHVHDFNDTRGISLYPMQCVGQQRCCLCDFPCNGCIWKITLCCSFCCCCWLFTFSYTRRMLHPLVYGYVSSNLFWNLNRFPIVLQGTQFKTLGSIYSVRLYNKLKISVADLLSLIQKQKLLYRKYSDC